MRRTGHHAAESPSIRLPRRRIAVTAGVVLTVGAATVGVVSTGWDSPASTNNCALGHRALQVVAAPEIAPVIKETVRALSTPDAPACPEPVVRAEEPSRTARAIATDRARRPDVWVPDSSLWTGPLAPGSAGSWARKSPSIASSPYVLAVPESAVTTRGSSAEPSVSDLLPSAAGAPLLWSLPDPRRSSSSVGALLMARRALQGHPDRTTALAFLLRGIELATSPGLDRVEVGAKSTPVVVPTTEQRATAYNEKQPNKTLALAYSDDLSSGADYPYVVLAATRSRRLAADDLLDKLRGDPGRGLLAAAGFRNRFGAAGAALTARPEVDPRTRLTRAPRPDVVKSVVDGFVAVRRPSRLLTVLDVSGSMANVVPEAGGATRLDLAVRALMTGLATYPDDTFAGLWTFSTDLTPTSDHRVLVPPTRLGINPDGRTGRGSLATALGRVQVVPDGGTGLYDSVLAAVRAARASWDPHRVNSVILVTDGANQDDNGITLPALLRTLSAERDRSRPVTVFAVAYGPSADHHALQSIVRATGGVAYRAPDYRDLPSVIARAIGRREATPQGRHDIEGQE
jgi:Mg-chelatase subunit ChlD